MSIRLHNRDIRSLLSDRAPALSPDCLGWFRASMSPFYPESDLASAPSSILTKRAQKSVLFPGRTLDVLAPLHLPNCCRLSSGPFFSLNGWCRPNVIRRTELFGLGARAVVWVAPGTPAAHARPTPAHRGPGRRPRP